MDSLIEIKSGGIVYLESTPLNMASAIDANDLFLTLSDIYTQLEDGLTLGELLSAFYRCSKLVDNLFSEDFETLRILINTPIPAENKIKELVFKKQFTVEEEDEKDFIYLIPTAEFTVDLSLDKAYKTLSSVPIVLDEDIELATHLGPLKYKTKFTLMEVMSCLFDDTSDLIKHGNALTDGLTDEHLSIS